MSDTKKTSDHQGAGDPGGVDPGTPVPGSGGGESRADVEAAFGGASPSDSKVDQLVAKAGAMKDRASALSGEITGIQKDGEAAGGLVRATVDGAGNLKSITIDPSLMDGEAAVLQELIVNAVQSAKAQVAEEAAGKVSEMVGGLPIPQSVASLIAQFLPKK